MELIYIVSKTDGYESCIRIYRKNSHIFLIYIYMAIYIRGLTIMFEKERRCRILKCLCKLKEMVYKTFENVLRENIILIALH